MEFEAGAAIAFTLMIAAFIVDWPRALVGLAWGAISSYLPYGTIVVPVGIVVIAAAGEFFYAAIGRTSEPSPGSFAIGLFSVAGTAASLYISLRNLKDRL